MSWTRIDDQFHGHHKIKRAWKCRAALGLHVMAMSYSACYDLHGRVPVEFVEEKLPRARERDAAVIALVDAGMWEPDRDDPARGWYIHDWHEYNGTAKSREEIRAAKSAAGKKGAAARWGDGKPIAECHTDCHEPANGTDMAPSPSPFLNSKVGSPANAHGGASADRTAPISVDEERTALADKIVGVLQRGIDGLTTDEYCKSPTRPAVLAALGDAPADVALDAATAVRSIAQAQNRAPNIVGLFANRLTANKEAA
jgi:hypothetical protein